MSDDFKGTVSQQYRMKYCAADAAFWAEQLKVAIPGWLCLDQKDGLHQEEQLTSRKKVRCHVIKEKEAKRRIPLCGGETRWRPKPSPPPQVADSPPKTGGFGSKAPSPTWRLVPKSLRDQMWQITWQVRIYGQSRNFPANSSTSGFSEKPF
jgi:hypothetical protein